MRFILDAADPKPRPVLAKLHPARQALIRELDNPHVNNVRRLVSVGE
jgi:hypothetical protein